MHNRTVQPTQCRRAHAHIRAQSTCYTDTMSKMQHVHRGSRPYRSFHPIYSRSAALLYRHYVDDAHSRSAAHLYRHYVDDATCPLRQPISSVKPPHSWYDCPLDSTTKSIQLPLGQYDAAKSVPLSIGQYCTNPSLYACPLDRTAQCKSVLSKSDDGSPPPFFFFSFFPYHHLVFILQGCHVVFYLSRFFPTLALKP